MGIVSLPSFGSDPVTVTAAGLDGKVDPLATEFNGSIDNDNIKAAAGIVYSKLTLTGNVAYADLSGTALSAVTQVLTMSGKAINQAKCADIASATTTTIWATDGNFAHITGTTTITGFGTAAQAGAERTIVFDGILTLTHNATSLILPTGANITTAAGDTAIVRAETTANARVIAYYRKDGTALSSASASTQAEQETGTSTTTYVSPGRQHYHQSAIKAHMCFSGTGTPTAIGTPYNFSSTITDNGTGDYTLTFTNALSSSNYVFIATAHNDTAGTFNVTATSKQTTTVRFTVTNSADAAADAAKVNILILGDI